MASGWVVLLSVENFSGRNWQELIEASKESKGIKKKNTKKRKRFVQVEKALEVCAKM